MSSQTMAQDTIIAPSTCGAPSGTTFHGLSFGSITPAGVFQSSYTLPNAAVIDGGIVNVNVSFDTTPAPGNLANTPDLIDGDFNFNTSDANGTRTVTYNFVNADTSAPVVGNYRIRFADIDQNEEIEVDLNQFSGLARNVASNLTISDNGTTLSVVGAAGNRNIVQTDTAEFIVTQRSSFTVTVFPKFPNTGFTFDGDLSLPLGSAQCQSYSTIAASPESFVTMSGIVGGTTSISVLESDTLAGLPVTISDVTLSVLASDSRVTLNINTGLITVAPGTPDGAYTVNYQICEIANSSNCAITTETVNVDVPVSAVKGQSCPSGTSNLIAGSNFSDATFADWSQAGPNAGNLTVRSYTGAPSGVAHGSVVYEDADSTSGTLFQTLTSGLSSAGTRQIRMDFGWSNDGAASTMIYSVAGINVFSVTTSAASNNIDPADFSFLNGASGQIGDIAFGSNMSGKFPIATNNRWDLTSVVIDLPAGLPDSGNVSFSYTLGMDDWVMDNFLFCGVDSMANITANKTVRMVNASQYSIPGNDVLYTIGVQNTGTSDIDTDTVVIIDKLPPEIEFYNGDIDDGGPETGTIIFSQTNTNLTFSSLTDLRYSNSTTAPTSFATCGYVPVSGYDPAVTHICFNPKGTLGIGTPTPEATLTFRAKIR